MSDTEEKNETSVLPVDIEKATQMASDYFEKGPCDRAILQVLRDIAWLPSDRWDFDEFFSYRPKAGEQFFCKCLATGAVAIYLGILLKRDIDRVGVESNNGNSIERLLNIFNTYLLESIRGNMKNPADCDPFKYDEYMREVDVAEDVRKAFEERMKAFWASFQEQFGVSHCTDVLGFCPFCIEIYDEKKREWISQGEWRQQCDEVIQFSVKAILHDIP